MERTLYLPIHDPSLRERSLANKHGLRDAFEAYGACLEWDYIANDKTTAYEGLITRIDTFNPTLVFMQLGSTEHFTAAQIAAIRRAYPHIRFANWNGDVYEDVLLAPPMLELLCQFDVQLVVNASVLDAYAANGINAAFWPFGFETANRELPDVPAYDVVYLGNNYSDKRADLYKVLRSLPYSVGIYGSGWPQSEGECTYDFTYGEALYRKARFTISDNQFPLAEAYLSNRPFQAMAAGCLVLQQYVRKLYEYTGLMHQAQFVGFTYLDELPQLIAYYLDPHHKIQCEYIAEHGQALVLKHHSFEARVKQLFVELLPKIERVTL